MRTKRRSGVWHSEENWKATALEAEEWVEMATEGGRRFMAAWRKDEVDATRVSPGEERGSETGKIIIVHGSVEPARSETNLFGFTF